MNLQSILLSSGAFIALASASQAFALDEAVAETVVDESGVSDQIVVTARRREENIQDVPISVSALGGEQLKDAGVDDIQDLQYQTPSLSVTTGFSQRNNVAFALRGQRTQETQIFTDPPVGTYFAEVVQPRPYGFGNALYDLESVQVLKGVQGTLFGRNMTGGAILVEPKHPTLGEFSGEISGSYGNYDMKEGLAAINIPVGESLAFRLAGKVRRRDGWAHEVTSGVDYDNQSYETFRASMLFQPSDSFESLTIFDWYNSEERGTAAFLTSLVLPSAITNYENLRLGGLITTNVPAEFAAAQALFAANRFSFDIGAGEGGNLDAFGAPYENVKNYGVTNKTTIELTENLTLKNIAGFRRNTRDVVQDFDGIPAFLITPNQFARVSGYSEELQLQGNAFENRLTFILGGYFFKEEGIDGSNANTLPQLTFAGAMVPQTTPAALFQIANPGEGSSTTYAGFAAGTFAITPEVTVSGGVRYNYDKREITVSPQRTMLGVCEFDLDLITPGVQSVPIDECSFSNDVSFDEITYDATLQYQPVDAFMGYASFRHGFRAGGFSTRAQNFIALEPFLPEEVDEYEIGLKTTSNLGEGRLTTSLAIFQQDLSNAQKQRASSFDTNGDGVPDTVVTIVDNTAKQRHRGGEFEAAYSNGGLELNAFYSYTDVQILEGATVAPIGLPEIEQRGTPKHQLGISGTITTPLRNNLGDLAFTTNYTWRSENFLDDFEIEGRQPAFSLINMRLAWRNVAQSGVNASLFVTNLTDETYRIGVLGLMAEGLGFQSSVYGEPRMYGVEIGYSF